MPKNCCAVLCRPSAVGCGLEGAIVMIVMLHLVNNDSKSRLNRESISGTPNDRPAVLCKPSVVLQGLVVRFVRFVLSFASFDSCAVLCRPSAVLRGHGEGVMPPRPSMSPPTSGTELWKQASSSFYSVSAHIISALWWVTICGQHFRHCWIWAQMTVTLQCSWTLCILRQTISAILLTAATSHIALLVLLTSALVASLCVAFGNVRCQNGF